MVHKYDTPAEALAAKQTRDRGHQLAYRPRRKLIRITSVRTEVPDGVVETRRSQLGDGRIVWTHYMATGSKVRAVGVTVTDRRTVITPPVRAAHDAVVASLGGTS